MRSSRCARSRPPQQAQLAVRFGLLLFVLAGGVEEYVKVINGRCAEFVGALPLGGPGRNWTEGLDHAARTWCDGRKWCVGYMRYLGGDPHHKDAWRGRPQFCYRVLLTHDDQWVSYLRASAAASSQEPGATDGEGDNDAPPAGPESVVCPWPYGGSLTLWSGELPPGTDAGALGAEGGEGSCHVLHHRRGQALPELWREGEAGHEAVFHGILSDDESVVHYFSADATFEPWAYSVDSNEYIGATIEGADAAFGPKVHYLSLFFLSPDAACDGSEPRQWGPLEADEVMPGHVFVDDGTVETRRSAFNPYHFTVICGDVEEAGFLPQAVVDALSFATHPLVAKPLHRLLHRIFFHLPDAVQPYSRIHPLMLEDYVEKLYLDPAKNDAMYYKQTFLFLLQELLHYRYRQPFQQRLEVAACALCKERRRRHRLAEAAEEAGGGREAVGIAVCVMSRRSGHELRAAIRETWATRVTGAAALRFFVGKATPGIGSGGGAEGAAVLDSGFGDVVELAAPEAYQAVTLKAFSMLDWAHQAFPNLRFLVRADDDVYLRPGPLFAQLERRPPVAYLWGNIDHGSNPVRDPRHAHYNSLEQFPERRHPLFGDIFPPYARGHLWAMSADLLAMVVDVWHGELMRHKNLSLALASRLPHPDDPALGVALANLVDQDQLSLNIDDRDLNSFALNPSCNATYLNIHNRTWAVHHVDVDTMHCMWDVDSAAGDCAWTERGCGGIFPDLCPCSMDVVEEVDDRFDEPFDYPRERFNDD